MVKMCKNVISRHPNCGGQAITEPHSQGLIFWTILAPYPSKGHITNAKGYMTKRLIATYDRKSKCMGWQHLSRTTISSPSASHGRIMLISTMEAMIKSWIISCSSLLWRLRSNHGSSHAHLYYGDYDQIMDRTTCKETAAHPSFGRIYGATVSLLVWLLGLRLNKITLFKSPVVPRTRYRNRSWYETWRSLGTTGLQVLTWEELMCWTTWWLLFY